MNNQWYVLGFILLLENKLNFDLNLIMKNVELDECDLS